MSDNSKEVKINTPFDRPENRVKREVETKAITIQASATPQQNIDVILLNQHAIQELKKSMTFGVHYGPPYKNSKKDTLLKPGAEWTQKLFGIKPHFEELDKIIQPNFDDLSKSWILFRYRCVMIEITSGLIVGEAIGACHSLEDKYHWRKATRTCVDPNCNGDVYRSKYPDNLPEEKRGWYCKECKAKYAADDTRITGQEVGQTVNANPMDLVNTLDKIAQKRAYVSAVLNATAASSIFAPGDDAIDDIDVSDIIDADFTEAPTPPEPQAETTPEPEAPADSKPKGKTLDTKILKEVIAFMYPDDQDEFHRNGTIKNLMANGTLTPHMSGYEAVETIILHRAFKDYELDELKVFKALTVAANEPEVITTWAAWYKDRKGSITAHQEAWEAIVAYHENANLEPAKAGKKTKDAPETTPLGNDVEIPF